MSTETEVKTVKILVTGGAGFIGSHLMNSLLTKEYDLYCVGVDNFNNYYDPQLKKDRCEEFGLEIRDCDLNDFERLDMLFTKELTHNKTFVDGKVFNFGSHINTRCFHLVSEEIKKVNHT